MKIDGLSRWALVLAGVTFASAVPARAETTLKLLASWSKGQIITADYGINTVTTEAVELGKGQLKISRSGPEVVPPFEQLQPVSSGAFDMLYTHPAYHGSATAIGMLMDTVTPDVERRHSTGVWDWFDNYYQKHHNLKLVGMLPSIGYQFLLREPLDPKKAFAGLKIRSNPTYDPLVKGFGGAPVLLPVSQIYPSLQKGLIDGTAFPLQSMARAKYYEVAKYMARPGYGTGTNLWAINLDKWKKLDGAIQTALLDAGRKGEQLQLTFAKKVQAQEEEAMIKHGASFTFFADDQASKLTRLFNEGLWEQAMKRNGEEAKEIVDLLKKSSMVNN